MKKKKKGFLLAFPAISGFLFFYLIRFLFVLWFSVCFGIGYREFVGLDNYKELFKNTMFLLAVKNTCKYMLVTIPVTLGTALCISVILQQITKGQKIFRLSFLYPIIMPIASIVLVIQFFFKNNGFLNLILNFFYLPEKDWLHTSSAFWIICILYFWKFVGYYIFIYSSRLQMIPKEYYEYASLHGAGKWQSFYYITCPILFPVILFTLILSIMNAFKCYREAFLLGGTHPDNSIYFLQHFMNNNLQNLNYQKVSASATIITVFILFLSGLIYMIYYFLKRRTADA